MFKAGFLSALGYGKQVHDRGGLHDPGDNASDRGAVSRKLLAEFGVDAELVAMQGTLARNTRANDSDQVFGCAVNVKVADVSPAFD